MHAEERLYVQDAFDTNWMSCLGKNIDEVERLTGETVGCSHAVALSCGTAALHLAVKLAGEKVYGIPEHGRLTLEGKRVFVSDTTFAATVNPIIYEGGSRYSSILSAKPGIWILKRWIGRFANSRM